MRIRARATSVVHELATRNGRRTTQSIRTPQSPRTCIATPVRFGCRMGLIMSSSAGRTTSRHAAYGMSRLKGLAVEQKTDVFLGITSFTNLCSSCVLPVPAVEGE